MRIESEAIVVAVRGHGEHGAIARLLTPADGLQAGYVRGGRSRRLRPVLAPGNLVQAELRARTDTQLPQLSVELIHSRAPLFVEPLAAAGVEWSCALTAAALPEGQPYPALHAGLDGLLGAIEAAPSARGWVAALVRYELLLLDQLGYGLDAERLLSLPPGLRGGAVEDRAVREGLRISGAALARDVLIDRRAEILAARERLVARLARMAG